MRCNCESEFCEHVPSHCSNEATGQFRMEYVGLVCEACAKVAREHGGADWIHESEPSTPPAVFVRPTADRDEIVRDGRALSPLEFEEAASYTGPGAYQAASDRPLAVALDLIVGHGFADAQAGSTDEGLHGGRVGRFILWTDDQGFRTVQEFDSDNAAQVVLDSGPQSSEEA